MIRTSVLAVVLLAASISDVLADDPPPRKPGLWEVASGHKGEAPTVARMCFDAASEAKMNKMADETLAVGCTRHESHLSGNVLTTDSVCNLMGFDKSSHGVMNFDGDTAYTLTTTARDNAAKAGRPDERFVQIGRWLGECGADLKPGEMLVAGKKMSFIGKR